MTGYLKKLVRLGALLAVITLLTAFVAACGGDDDTTTATSSSSGATATKSSGGASTSTTGSSAATSTTGVGAASTATTGSNNAATPTIQTATEATATTSSAPKATATTEDAETPTSEADEATATTEGSSETATSTDDTADYHPLDPNQLPNFTLTANYDFQGTSADPESSDGTFAMDIEQSAVDNYHTKIDTGDPTEAIETWRDGDNTWVSYGGEITQMPEGTDPSLYSPASFLNQVPDFEEQLKPTKVGEDNVSGRKTTHYKANAEQFLDLMSESDDTGYLNGATNEDGKVEIWIDKELQIIMKLDVDVTWTNADGTPGKAVETYLISDIGSTDKVAPPQ
jgi:hypothetical protein